ncbi:NADH:flavin oxidoreductase/NADH oxidase family protein [Biformimicrobium ophioploci]|uniref:NADH:flavin oxidoreductase/NADH oxidase family protein n=2 Tax=Biformimicrobium ophioploci TaxID=3036711 RepID=A0ABQ6LWI6_9GAMM|nr:NADH:flavin oxidoreductase/NADH oxidase family protein [Microbulbifer sp. NKW57]
MTEGLADPLGRPTEALANLYGAWSDGGAGLLLSGNIQVDGDHLERPGNVIIQGEPDAELRAALAQWAAAATRNGNHFWAQISHAGRQTQKNVNPSPKAPSAVKVKLPGGQFGMPQPLEIAEIEDIVQRFAIAAKAVVAAGFTGVQVHGAHGYLVSQFLSPRSNQRTDIYGGSLENRARLLLQIVSAVRAAIGPQVPLAVKLNSADFQKGGFDFEDSQQVVQWLEQAGVDLVEISGGTYEQPKLLGVQGIEAEEKQHVAESTAKREAYFVDFALAMQEKVNIPLMVTGGFRQRAVMERAIESGSADMVGLGRPLCLVPDAPARLLDGEEELERFEDSVALLPGWLQFLNRSNAMRSLSAFSLQYWYYCQLEEIGRNGKADRGLSVLAASKRILVQQSRWLRQRRKLQGQAATALPA